MVAKHHIWRGHCHFSLASTVSAVQPSGSCFSHRLMCPPSVCKLWSVTHFLIGCPLPAFSTVIFSCRLRGGLHFHNDPMGQNASLNQGSWGRFGTVKMPVCALLRTFHFLIHGKKKEKEIKSSSACVWSSPADLAPVIRSRSYTVKVSITGHIRMTCYFPFAWLIREKKHFIMTIWKP